jgi:hypothetical protein
MVLWVTAACTFFWAKSALINCQDNKLRPILFGPGFAGTKYSDNGEAGKVWEASEERRTTFGEDVFAE